MILPPSASVGSIYDQVLGFIDSPDLAAFEPLAIEVYCYQFEHVPPYRAYCLARGAVPAKVHTVAAIPAVSTIAFKYARLETRKEPASAAARLFFTSGTTIGKNERGRHLVARPEVYCASALAHLRRMLFPDRRRTAMLALHPTADRMPESSLSQMISWCLDEFGGGAAMCAATPRAVDTGASIEFLREIARGRTPVTILGTTASFGALFAAMRAGGITIELPPASRLMDTGGAKGQAVPLSAAEIAAEAGQRLGIDPTMVINEYGMTEMCSQLYDATAFNSGYDAPPGGRIKLAPPWLGATALNPVTLEPVRSGEVGLLAFFDLANVGSVSALMTEDFGVVNGDGIAIIGRATGDLRGCALAIEEFRSHDRTNAAGHPRA